jgi:hypothetical protein
MAMWPSGAVKPSRRCLRGVTNCHAAGLCQRSGKRQDLAACRSIASFLAMTGKVAR